MTKASRIQIALASATAVLLTVASGAHADPTKCKQGIAKASSKYVQGRTKALQKCEDLKTKGVLSNSTVCTSEMKTELKLQKLDDKIKLDVAKACGGADKNCSTTNDNDSLASIGWGGVCPDFESSGCNNAISNCGDIADCLECIDDEAVDQAIELYYAALVQGEFGTNSVVNKCQRAIGKETAKFLNAKSKALQKCWDAALKGTGSTPCPTPGDGKASLAISKAETKKVTNICKACGGADKLCDGNADLTPGAIGFSSTCPSVCSSLTGCSICGNPVVTADDLVKCVDCVTEFKVDCMDALAVPEFVPLPAMCNPNPTTTTTSTTVTTSTTTTTTTTTTLATTTTTTLATTTTTTTTLATTSTTTTTTTTSTTTTTGGATPNFLDFTTVVGVGVCGHTYRTTDFTGNALVNLGCGGLDIGGGQSTVAEGPTPDGSTNRFTLSCVGSNCTVGPTATDGVGFKCTNTGCVFGTPLPIVNGTLSTCVQNTFAAPASGTLDTSNGHASMNVPLSSGTVVTGNATQPCPLCRMGTITGAPCAGSPGLPCTGVCEGSPNQGSACVSTNSQGLTNDCPNVASTGAGNRCYKGSNNNGSCTSNVNCTGGVCAIFVGNIPVNLSPATTSTASLVDAGGIFCPTKHCQSGTNYGAVCTVDADCAGSTQTNRCIGQNAGSQGAFKTGICVAGANSGLPCKVNGDCPTSTCGTKMCVGGSADGKGCTSNANCPGSGAACTGGPNAQGTCAAGEICSAATGGVCQRPCKIAGTLAQSIKEDGTAPEASLLPLGSSHSATLASVFCIPDADSSPNGSGQGFLISGAANLPGPGATTLAGTMVLRP